MKKELIQGFDGYNEIINEIQVFRKYGIDYTLDKGSVEECIRRLHPVRMRLQVSDIIDETESAGTLRLVSKDQDLPPFQAGQYISLSIETGGILTSRPYSISSPPNQTGYYEITVRRVDNGLVSCYLLDQVKRRDVLESSGPCGLFHYNPIFHDSTMVCIAGGSGITPFMSMIQEVIECGLDRTIYLFYGNRTSTDVIFHDRLSNIAEKFENIHYIPVIEEPKEGYDGAKGLITGSLIKEAIGDINAKTFYLCGPQAMYDFCLKELEQLGVPARKTRKEVYGAPVNVSEQPGWPEGLKEDKVWRVRVNEGSAFEASA
ncbi:MAG: ferredoxin reductase, partial [Methanosarcinaceae archaeon]|nr:ferredoxin reductase [Methanosarcinaceae archaeon]